jgi:hypothetical protein
MSVRVHCDMCGRPLALAYNSTLEEGGATMSATGVGIAQTVRHFCTAATGGRDCLQEAFDAFDSLLEGRRLDLGLEWQLVSSAAPIPRAAGVDAART